MAISGRTESDSAASHTEILSGSKLNLLTTPSASEDEAKRKEVSRSFISDTITVPTPGMYAHALQASLGDAVYGDKSTQALEDAVAILTGKEAALFMPSGTMSNQIAIRTHLKQPPYSVLCDKRSHVYAYEAGGIGFHSGAGVIPVLPANGHHLTLDDVKANIMIGTDMHIATTHLISLENTLNGTIMPQSGIISICDYARSQEIKVHLDGARLWDVAASTGTSLAELCSPLDSVSLCLSKGLGAPVGSVLVGKADFIAQARRFRKLFGGGMRQTGFLAAAGAYAIAHNFPQLPRVHELARKLEKGLEELGFHIVSRAETCMFFFDPSPVDISYNELISRASELPEPIHLSGSRIVVHLQTSPAAIDDLLKLVQTLAKEKNGAGFIPSRESVNSAQPNIYRGIWLK